MNSRIRRTRLTSPIAHLLFALGMVVVVSACASAPKATNAQLLAPPADPCVLARQDAALDPHLDVERVPAPVKMDPAPIKTPVPRTVLRASKGTAIRAEVMIDTLGKPDMNTFKMLESPHTYYATNLKTAVAKWSFEPALRNGCRVPRYYQFIVNLGQRPGR